MDFINKFTLTLSILAVIGVIGLSIVKASELTQTSLIVSNGGAYVAGGSGDGLIVANGNVGIGVDPASSKLHVVGNSYFNGNVGIGTGSPTSRLQVTGNNSIDTTPDTTGVHMGQTQFSISGIELSSALGGGSYIDFDSDASTDYDVRLSTQIGSGLSGLKVLGDRLNAVDGFSVGSGVPAGIEGIYRYGKSWDPLQIPANGSLCTTIAATDAEVGDFVIVGGGHSDANRRLVDLFGYTAPGLIYICYGNWTSSNYDPGPETSFSVLLIKTNP